LTPKRLAKGHKTAFEGLLLVNPMHPTLIGLQGLKNGQRKTRTWRVLGLGFRLSLFSQNAKD
jgi:hypothetical protein